MKAYFIPADPEDPLWWILLKILIQTVIFWSLFLFVIPAGLMWIEELWGWHRFDFSGQQTLGLVLFVLGGSLGLTSGATMGIYGRGTPLPVDAARELVIAGPYRYVRNPMAIAGLTQGTAVALFVGSWLILVYVIIGFFLWNYYVRPVEEQDLQQRFAGDYSRYRCTIRCWFPRFHGYTSPTKITQDPD